MTKSKNLVTSEQLEIARVTKAVLKELGRCNIEVALTVVCGVAGHLVAALVDGKLSGVSRHADSIGKNIKAAAYAKLMHNDNERRKQ